jgi:hypothetical protein
MYEKGKDLTLYPVRIFAQAYVAQNDSSTLAPQQTARLRFGEQGGGFAPGTASIGWRMFLFFF